MMRGRDESFSIIEQALRAAQGDEADAVFVSVDRNISRFANSSLNQNMSEISGDLTLRVVVDGRVGVASTSSLDAEEITKTANLATDAAKRSEPIPGFKGLSRDNSPAPELKTFDEATAALTPAEKARDLRVVFDHGAQLGAHFAGSYTTAQASIATGNSHGIRRYAPLTWADALVIAISGSASGAATRISRRHTGVDFIALGDEALSKATLLPGTEKEIEPRAYDVILEPAALTEIFEWMNMITFSGQSYEDGSSFFVDRLGEEVVGRNVTIEDDPIDEDFLPFPFDMEGTAKRKIPLIENGIARTPVVDKLMSDRLGFAPTGSAAGLNSEDHGMSLHTSLVGGDKTRDELIAGTERGIWITRFHYLNGLLEPKSALMTGMTRDGTFLIENGKVTSRLVNLRWTQSMVEAFSNVVAMSKERRATGTWWNMIGGTIAPTMKIRGWNFTGVQK